MVVEFTEERYNKILERTGSKKNSSFAKWLKPKTKEPAYFDEKTYRYCYEVHKKLKQDYDHLSVVCGMEGSGKSTFSSQLLATISPGSGILHVCYEPQDFVKAFQISKPGDSIMLDEGALFLFSREANSRDNRRITKLLTICRQRNIHLIICIPNFFIIDSYVRDHRVGTLFQLTKRGHFVCFNKEALQLINKWGAPTKNVFFAKVPAKNLYRGYFNNVFGETETLSQEEYLKLKTEHMNRYLNDLERSLREEADVMSVDFLSLEQTATLLGFKIPNLKAKLNNDEIPFEYKQIGRLYYFPKKQFIEQGLLKEEEKKEEEKQW